ncbi:hypothetical protein N7488_004590 [Penicillium malachiteum]|nr:hypothetical protein N7488_004590 [Penicillium malachiteum]
MVMSHLEFVRDRNAFAQTNRRFYTILNREVYISAISDLDFSGILWAAKKDELQTLEHFFHAAKYGFNMAPNTSDIEWCPIWEVWPSWGARWEGDPLQKIAVFIYERGHGRYGSSHIPIICLYRDALVDAAKRGNVEAVRSLLEWMLVFFSIYVQQFMFNEMIGTPQEH